MAALQLGGPGAAVAVLTTLRAPSAGPVRHRHSALRSGAGSAVTYATSRPSRRLLRPRHRDGLRDDDPEFTMSTRGGPSRSQKCNSQAPDMPDLPPGAAVGPPNCQPLQQEHGALELNQVIKWAQCVIHIPDPELLEHPQA